MKSAVKNFWALSILAILGTACGSNAELKGARSSASSPESDDQEGTKSAAVRKQLPGEASPDSDEPTGLSEPEMVSGAFLTIDCLSGTSARSLRCRLLSEQGQSVIASGHRWVAVDGAGDETTLDVKVDDQDQFPYGVDIPEALPADAVILVASENAGTAGDIQIAASESIEQILVEAAVPLEERAGRAAIAKARENAVPVDIREVAVANPGKHLGNARSQDSDEEDSAYSEHDDDDHEDVENDRAHGQMGLEKGQGRPMQQILGQRGDD